jgi:Fe-S-cluster-containing dehydrogenase component
MINESNRELTRRRFLKLTGAGVGTLLLPPDAAAASGQVDAGHAAAMLYDATLCVGCRSCEVACKESNKLPLDAETTSDLTADTWTLIKQYEAFGVASFRKVQCMHCLHPACVAVCTVGALKKTKAGPVTYDADKCIGCRYCQYGCPFGVPRFDWDAALGLIGKCNFCEDRIAVGQLPACAEACPVGALSFGTRAEMLEEAYARIQQNPKRYVDHVYGETEAGGTSILFIAAVPFDKLGFPDLDSEPVTQSSTTVMNATPAIVTLAVPLLGGLYWLLRHPETEKEEAS